MAVIESSPHHPHHSYGLPSFDGSKLLVQLRDELATERLIRLLRPTGISVVSARSAEVLLERLRSERPDVVACDLELPDGDGMHLVRRIRMRSRLEGGATPAIALTSEPTRQAHTRALLAGFQAYVRPDALELCLALAQVMTDRGRQN